VNTYSSFETIDAELFRFIVFLIKDDQKDNCCCLFKIIREKLEIELKHTAVQLIVKRVQIGLELDEKRRA
jgi:hypothetical protein